MTMQAIISTRYGAPEVLTLSQMPIPMPKADEVQIRVRAASITPSDTAFRKGDPFIVRLIYGLNKPRLPIGGVEFAGEISAVGAAVTEFRVGDAVFGMSPDRFGAYAEYLCLPASKVILRKPESLDFPGAVAIVDGAATSLIFLRDVARVQPGQRVLINGASGALGTAAIQLAKEYGAHVTAVCSTANLDLVRSLGADAVIDYTREDFTRAESAYDVIYDTVGKSSFGQARRALKPGGIYMTTIPTLGLLVDLLRSRFGNKRVGFTTAGLKQSKDNLATLTALVESGRLRPTIDRCYPMAEIVEAHRYVDSGRKRGNVVLTLG